MPASFSLTPERVNSTVGPLRAEMWKSFRFSWSLCHQVRNHAERCRTSNPVAHKSRHHTQYPFSSYTCNRQTSDHCKSDSNPTAEASARLGRESFRFAWHEGRCKFSVRTNTRASGTFSKHNGQARFHMVIKFVSFFLRHLGMPRPERSRADTVPCRYSSRRIVAAHLANRAKQGRS